MRTLGEVATPSSKTTQTLYLWDVREVCAVTRALEIAVRHCRCFDQGLSQWHLQISVESTEGSQPDAGPSYMHHLEGSKICAHAMPLFCRVLRHPKS